MEKTHRAPPSRTQRAPTGVTTRIARTRITFRITLTSHLRRIHTLALTRIATHAAFLTPRITRLLRRLPGIRSLHDHYDYELAPASIRLCCRGLHHDGIRSHYDYDHALAASTRLCRDHDYEHEHEHEPSASIRLC